MFYAKEMEKSATVTKALQKITKDLWDKVMILEKNRHEEKDVEIESRESEVSRNSSVVKVNNMRVVGLFLLAYVIFGP